MILETIQKRVDELQNYAACLAKDAETYEEQLWAAQAALRAASDELALCELMLSVADGLSTGTPKAVEPKAVVRYGAGVSPYTPCVSDTYANPDILASRWRKGELPEAILNVLGREPERWFKPSEIMDEILKTHKRRTHSSSVSTVLGVLLSNSKINLRSGKYQAGR